jgi:pimeloyl-ACP methyl ester carboxylesterase
MEQNKSAPCYTGWQLSDAPGTPNIPVKQNTILSLPPVATIMLIITAAMVQPVDCRASDLEREQRLAEQTIDAIFDGEPRMLDASGQAFLGIYTETETIPEKGAAIILHGRGTHPDWEQVANPLRIALPAHGWSTLSLQMPVLAKDASFYDYEPIFPEAIPRIEAGIRYLRRQGTRRIVLIAHSCGVHMSMAWLKQQGDAGIDAYIGIGMGATDYQQPMRRPFPFDRIRVPLLNIYGSNDYPAVQRQAQQLEPLLAGINPASAQIQIEGADHYFDGQNEALVEAVIDWLETL